MAEEWPLIEPRLYQPFVYADRITGAWEQLCRMVLDHGVEVSPRGLRTKELRHVHVHFEKSLESTFLNPRRHANPVMHIVELMYFLNGRDDDALARVWLKGMERYVNPTTRLFDGGYGPSLRNGLPFVFAMLERDKDSRRAVISLLQERHTVRMLDTLDYPCNPLIGFRLEGGRLNVDLVTRSQDLYQGYVYDQLEFHMLQRMMAQALKVEPGSFDHYIFSCHLYEQNWQDAENCLVVGVGKSGLASFPIRDVPSFWDYVRHFNVMVDQPKLYPPEMLVEDDAARAVRNYAMRGQIIPSTWEHYVPAGPLDSWVKDWCLEGGRTKTNPSCKHREVG